MIVLDANILIRGVLGRRVRQILESYSGCGIRFHAPDVAYADAAKYLPEILKKRGKVADGVSAALDYLKHIAPPVDREAYGLFEEEARLRLRGRDEEDWPVLATALTLACAIWTEDVDFFGTGVPIWTTNGVEIFLRAQAASLQRSEI